MIDMISVLDCFSLLAGVCGEEKERCLPLCATAAAEIQNRLRGESETYESALVFAAAALALYRHRLMSCAREDTAVFKAGDVSITSDGPGSVLAAKRLYEMALADIAPILRDDDFLFQNT